MRKLILISLVVVVVGLRAQEAHVIALKSEDAAHAKRTWERLQAAQKEWEQVQEDIRNDYVLVPENSKEASHTVLSIQGESHTYRKGFESGFQFSEDFKYIVPKNSEIPNIPTSGSFNFITPGTGGTLHCANNICW